MLSIIVLTAHFVFSVKNVFWLSAVSWPSANWQYKKSGELIIYLTTECMLSYQFFNYCLMFLSLTKIACPKIVILMMTVIKLMLKQWLETGGSISASHVVLGDFNLDIINLNHNNTVLFQIIDEPKYMK